MPTAEMTARRTLAVPETDAGGQYQLEKWRYSSPMSSKAKEPSGTMSKDSSWEMGLYDLSATSKNRLVTMQYLHDT